MANILTFTEDFLNAVWTTFGSPGRTANTHAAPAFAGTSAGLADTLTDSDAGVQCNVKQSKAKGTDDTTNWTVSVYVRKDADSTRKPGIQMWFADGGTEKARGVYVNTVTGALTASGSLGGPASSGVEDVDATWWRVWMTEADNGLGNPNIQLVIFPAQATGGGTNDDSTPTGSVIVWGANVTHTGTVQPYEPDPTYSFVSRTDGLTVIRKA